MITEKCYPETPWSLHFSFPLASLPIMMEECTWYFVLWHVNHAHYFWIISYMMIDNSYDGHQGSPRKEIQRKQSWRRRIWRHQAAPQATLWIIMLFVVIYIYNVGTVHCYLRLSSSLATVGQREIMTEPTRTALNWVNPFEIWMFGLDWKGKITYLCLSPGWLVAWSRWRLQRQEVNRW